MLETLQRFRFESKTVPVIGVNNAGLLPGVDLCFFGDAKWYWWHEEDLRKCTAIKVTTNCYKTKREQVSRPVPLAVADIHFVKVVLNVRGINTIPGYINFNSSSGAAAINLAWHLGAKRVVLLGYDMRPINGWHNWHEPHPIPRSNKPYTNFLKRFEPIAIDARRLGLRIVNGTPNSALTVFPMVNANAYLR